MNAQTWNLIKIVPTRPSRGQSSLCTTVTVTLWHSARALPVLVTLGYTQQLGTGPVFILNIENRLIQSSTSVIPHQHLILHKCISLSDVSGWTQRPFFTRGIHFSHTNTLYRRNCLAEKSVRACLFCSWSASLLKQKKKTPITNTLCLYSLVMQ